MNFIGNFVDLFIESGFWMLLGLMVAGLLKEWVPTDLLAKHLGGKGAKTTIKAAFIGAPLPLCSCGVIPAALGLRRSGASKSATTSFLVATPETGIDSVSVSYALLGPFMAIIRPIAAITSAIVAGLLVGKEDEQSKAQLESAASSCCSTKKQTSCCSSKSQSPSTTVAAPVVSEPVKSSCCSSSSKSSSSNLSSKKSGGCSSASTVSNKSAVQKFKSGVSFAATDLVRDISTWLIIGLIFAALVQTYIETDFLAQWGGTIWSMLLMVAISVPMYICATASTPIAAGLLMSGISPGAVLVFMLAGPATNVATLGVVGKELGMRSLFAYLVGVVGTAIVFGLATDYLVSTYGFSVQSLSAGEHEVLPHWLSISSAIVLALLMLRHYASKATALLSR
ncbi:permease [Vibrio sp. UCD-FRSSP16_10]|uniref:SO_0444 family Cu/Zn efflux transporter n=1 Tax=unclassified Vibrio TaxID=2614977 RepID=UPI0007FE7489|nr:MULTISPECIES: SO_0444 family Cu/Zn efflux transporter [unclassified Vibrio]OBT16451.1 permease [Vibrio sp. UCD-FRSSP16_30]OBT21316.1 permease [Vibrio sp. UCD-FRSSP16_10]